MVQRRGTGEEIEVSVSERAEGGGRRPKRACGSGGEPREGWRDWWKVRGRKADEAGHEGELSIE